MRKCFNKVLPYCTVGWEYEYSLLATTSSAESANTDFSIRCYLDLALVKNY
jgi:hypothetical protein